MASGAALARADAPVVVIGGGVAGMQVVQEVARRGLPLVLFNGERWQPYNRINLTPLLAGDMQVEQLYVKSSVSSDALQVHSGKRITTINRAARTVSDESGSTWPYYKLALCTGSRPHIPPLEGVGLRGVFTFRDMDDAGKLLAATFRARRAVVIGGGLLGLEAARGMMRRGVETWVIEQQSHLMSQQLDEEGGALLALKLIEMGIQVRTGETVLAIQGQDAVETVLLGSGEFVDCDAVIICTGIRANVELAREVGLEVGRGIQVNQFMQTSDPNIYAVGECAEFNGRVYGLAGPAMEQATIAASHIMRQRTSYVGSVPAMRLKVAGTDVFSMGDVEGLLARKPRDRAVYKDPAGIYRRLVIDNGKLVGAISVGGAPEASRLQQAIREGKRVWPWEVREFQRTGRLWPSHQPTSVEHWPDGATVCNCTGTTRGKLCSAIQKGCSTMERLQSETGAGTVCGSCKPLLDQLLGQVSVHQPIQWGRPIAVLSALAALIVILTAFLPHVPLADTMLATVEMPKTGPVIAAPSWTPSKLGLKFPLDLLWLDGFWKQVSGFALLGVVAIGAILSLRKRVKWLRLGSFSGWRFVHVGLGVAALLVLFAHTGFRLGTSLNFWLMATFLSVSIVGAAAGAVKAAEHRLSNARTSSGRQPWRIPVWLHIVAVWPLPLLLAVHILTVYYY